MCREQEMGLGFYTAEGGRWGRMLTLAEEGGPIACPPVPSAKVGPDGSPLPSLEGAGVGPGNHGASDRGSYQRKLPIVGYLCTVRSRNKGSDPKIPSCAAPESY